MDNIAAGMLTIAYLLFGALFVRLSRIVSRLEVVEQRLRFLERPAVIPVPPVREPDLAPPPVVPPKPEPQPIVLPEPQFTPDGPQFMAESPDVFERMVSKSGGWEELIGGNLLNKLGALVLVIGIALFLSYSFSNMGPAGRAFTSLALSGTLLISGVLVESRERYRAFSRGLMAAGWAGLYLTSYAMYALPAARIIDSPIVGTMLMTAVAVSMVIHSLRYHVESLTALAFGCILAALAFSPLNTFVAIALVPLSAAVLYLSRRFDWQGLALFAAAGTYAVFITRPATGAPLWSIQTMLFIFWLMFEAFDLLRLRSSGTDSPWHQALFAVNAVAGLAASGALWYRMAPDSMWLFSAGAATLYLASTWIRFFLDGKTYYEFSLILSAILAGLAIFARVPGMWLSIGLMLEAEVLFLAAHRFRIPVAKVLSWVGFTVALREIFRHFFVNTTVLGGVPIGDGTPPLALIAVLFYLNRYLSKAEPHWSYFASAFVTIITLRETRSHDWAGIIQLAWSAFLFEFGLRKKLSEFRVQSYVVASLSFAITALLSLSQESAAWPAALAALVFYAQTLRCEFWLHNASPREQRFVSIGGSLATALLAAILVHKVVPTQFEAVALMMALAALFELGRRGLPADLGWIARALSTVPVLMALFDAPADPVYRITGGAAVAALQFLIHFRARQQTLFEIHGTAAALIVAATLFNEVSGGMLTLSWSLEGIALLAAGFIARDRWLRLAGLGLLLLCIGKVFFYDLRNLETFYRILSFIGLGMILLAVSWIYTRFKEQMQKLL